jgi:hypothetical protein
MLDGVHVLEAPTDAERALTLGPTVVAMAALREGRVPTWDFRHFRSVVLHRGHHRDLLVEEAATPPAAAVRIAPARSRPGGRLLANRCRSDQPL